MKIIEIEGQKELSGGCDSREQHPEDAEDAGGRTTLGKGAEMITNGRMMAGCVFRSAGRANAGIMEMKRIKSVIYTLPPKRRILRACEQGQIQKRR